jgi:hypothetical protein
MGHIRLGSIPKSKAWSQVVSTLTKSAQKLTEREGDYAPDFAWSGGWAEAKGVAPGGASSGSNLAAIAAETLVASERALNRATDDAGFRYTFFLLTRVAQASRSPDWQQLLRSHGLELRPDSTVFDLTTEFQEAVDRYVSTTGRSTDIAEIAQKAAGEALLERIGERAETLFGNSGEELRNAIRGVSTKAGFGDLSRSFFASFLSRHLNFYLSRITAAELGAGVMNGLKDITEFNRALKQHCYESAAIVHDFLGEWYSKAEYHGGVTQQTAAGAAAVALQKLQAEIRSQREGG